MQYRADDLLKDMAKDPDTFNTTPSELLGIWKAYEMNGFDLSGWLTFDELRKLSSKKASMRTLRR